MPAQFRFAFVSALFSLAATVLPPLTLPLSIVQFADLHYGEAENLSWGPEQDANSSRVMRLVLDAEPDAGLVVFSGDQITGNNVGQNATAYSRIIYDSIGEGGKGKRKFASIFGNHDDAPLDARPRGRALSSTSRRALLDFERATYPQQSLTCGDEGCDPSLAPAVSNYYLLVRNASGAPRAALFFLDSGGGDFAEELLASVTAWLRATAARLADAYGPLPSITFVHIPAPEYAAAAGEGGCVGMAEDGITPTVGENDLVAVLSATTTARVVTVGHDHGNAWCCRARTLALCFGRHTGYGGYGDWARGARVFAIAEDAAARDGIRITSHVRMEDGSINSEEVL
jgi:hypothetical protein